MPSRIPSLPVLLAASLIGAVAGVAGALIVAAYVLPPTVPEGVAGARPRAAEPATDAEALSRAASAAVRISGPGTRTVAGTAFAPEALRGMAVALTADGWLVADRAVSLADAALVTAGGRLLAVERAVDAPALGIVFLKTDGRDLQVASFGDSRAVEPGTALFAPDAVGLRTLAAVSATARDGAPGAPEGTADFRRRILAQGSAPAGAPLVSPEGGIVGIVLTAPRGASPDAVRALPVETLRQALSRAIAGEVRFADIGVRGIPLSSVAVPEPENVARSGWMVVEVPRGGDVPLQTGDVVRSVGSDAVTAATPLAEILAGYAVGASPELLVLRDGQELRIPVPLTLP